MIFFLERRGPQAVHTVKAFETVWSSSQGRLSHQSSQESGSQRNLDLQGRTGGLNRLFPLQNSGIVLQNLLSCLVTGDTLDRLSVKFPIFL